MHFIISFQHRIPIKNLLIFWIETHSFLQELKHNFLGAYTPLTSEGNIIVDGILASCYADVNDHAVAHLEMILMRKFATVVEWVFGDDIGFSVFAKTLIHFRDTYCQL